jgi:hypothetical protein
MLWFMPHAGNLPTELRSYKARGRINKQPGKDGENEL